MLSGHARGEGRDQGERAGAHSLNAPVAGIPLYDGFNSLAIRAKNSRYDLASHERLIVSFAGISSDQSRSQEGLREEIL